VYLDEYASQNGGVAYTQLPGELTLMGPGLAGDLRFLGDVGWNTGGNSREIGGVIGLHPDGHLVLDGATIRWGKEMEMFLSTTCVDQTLRTVGHVHTHPLRNVPNVPMDVDGTAHSPTDLHSFSRLSLAFSIVLTGFRIYLITRTRDSVPTTDIQTLEGLGDGQEERYEQQIMGRLYNSHALTWVRPELVDGEFPKRVHPELETILSGHGIHLANPVRVQKTGSYIWRFTWGGHGVLYFVRRGPGSGEPYVVARPLPDQVMQETQAKFPRKSTVYRMRIHSRAYGYGLYKGHMRDWTSTENIVLTRLE